MVTEVRDGIAAMTYPALDAPVAAFDAIGEVASIESAGYFVNISTFLADESLDWSSCFKGVLSSGGTALRKGSDFAGRTANTAAYVVAGGTAVAAAGYGFLSGCSPLTPGRCGT